MNTVPYILLVLSVLCFALGCWLDRKSRRHTGLDIDEISVVCMDCGRHISGPLPHRARAVSHGLCPQCADVWKRTMLPGPLPTSRN